MKWILLLVVFLSACNNQSSQPTQVPPSEKSNIKTSPTPGELVKASSKGDLNRVSELLSKGANINEVILENGYEITPLLAAIIFRQEEVATFLINGKAKPYSGHQGYSVKEFALKQFGSNSRVYKELVRLEERYKVDSDLSVQPQRQVLSDVAGVNKIVFEQVTLESIFDAPEKLANLIAFHIISRCYLQAKAIGKEIPQAILQIILKEFLSRLRKANNKSSFVDQDTWVNILKDVAKVIPEVVLATKNEASSIIKIQGLNGVVLDVFVEASAYWLRVLNLINSLENQNSFLDFHSKASLLISNSYDVGMKHPILMQLYNQNISQKMGGVMGEKAKANIFNAPILKQGALIIPTQLTDLYHVQAKGLDKKDHLAGKEEELRSVIKKIQSHSINLLRFASTLRDDLRLGKKDGGGFFNSQLDAAIKEVSVAISLSKALDATTATVFASTSTMAIEIAKLTSDFYKTTSGGNKVDVSAARYLVSGLALNLNVLKALKETENGFRFIATPHLDAIADYVRVLHEHLQQEFLELDPNLSQMFNMVCAGFQKGTNLNDVLNAIRNPHFIDVEGIGYLFTKAPTLYSTSELAGCFPMSKISEEKFLECLGAFEVYAASFAKGAGFSFNESKLTKIDIYASAKTALRSPTWYGTNYVLDFSAKFLKTIPSQREGYAVVDLDYWKQAMRTFYVFLLSNTDFVKIHSEAIQKRLASLAELLKEHGSSVFTLSNYEILYLNKDSGQIRTIPTLFKAAQDYKEVLEATLSIKEESKTHLDAVEGARKYLLKVFHIVLPESFYANDEISKFFFGRERIPTSWDLKMNSMGESREKLKAKATVSVENLLKYIKDLELRTKTEVHPDIFDSHAQIGAMNQWIKLVVPTESFETVLTRIQSKINSI